MDLSELEEMTPSHLARVAKEEEDAMKSASEQRKKKKKKTKETPQPNLLLCRVPSPKGRLPKLTLLS